MKQKLSVVLGIALLAFVGIAMSGALEPGIPGLVKVGSGEAEVVMGGGQKGHKSCDLDEQSCASTLNSECSAKGPDIHGDMVNQGFVATGYYTCGGSSCDAFTINADATRAQE